MSPELTHLVTLQAIDLELAYHRAGLAALPKRIAAAELALKQAETSLAATKAALAKEEVLRRSQEIDTATHRTKITRLQKQMETATSAAQIAALEHEITFASSAITTLEDAELDSMSRTETHDAELTRLTALVATTTETLAETRTASASLTEEHNAALATLTTERTALREALITGTPLPFLSSRSAAEGPAVASDQEPTTAWNPDSGEALLSNYDRIAKGKGTGLAEAIDHKCSACQMMFRTQRWNDLTGRDHLDDIFTCETCGRLLFYDTRHDTPGTIPSIDRLRSAHRLAK